MKLRILCLWVVVVSACSAKTATSGEQLLDDDASTTDDTTADDSTGDTSNCTSVGCPCTTGDQCASKLCGDKGKCVSCIVSNGGVEKCDGLDNNCNGLTDESTCPGDGKCLLGVCDGAANTCHMTPAPDLSGCDDGNACTLADKCAAGTCGGTATSCEDGSPCTSEDCAPATGCQYLPVDGTCTDNNACTFADTCTGGACVGTPKNCDDGNPCSTDACAGGVCLSEANTATCDDGDGCTQSDTCKDLKCAGMPNCQDGDPCTLDACDSQTLACSHIPKVGWQAPACTACAPGFTGSNCDACSDPTLTWPNCVSQP